MLSKTVADMMLCIQDSISSWCSAIADCYMKNKLGGLGWDCLLHLGVHMQGPPQKQRFGNEIRLITYKVIYSLGCFITSILQQSNYHSHHLSIGIINPDTVVLHGV